MNKYRIEKELVKACSSDEVDIILSEINDIDDSKEIIRMLLNRIDKQSTELRLNKILNNTSQSGIYRYK